MLLNPLPLFARESRRWFVRSLLRVFGAGALSRVEFRDFFLGDELNSLAFSMSTLWYFGCEYKHGKWESGRGRGKGRTPACVITDLKGLIFFLVRPRNRLGGPLPMRPERDVLDSRSVAHRTCLLIFFPGY